MNAHAVIQNTIIDIMTSVASEKGLSVTLDARTNLLEAGFDSFDFVLLVTELEKRLALAIDLSGAEPETFLQVGSLAELLGRSSTEKPHGAPALE